jgi:hypothetical protein
MKTIGHIVKLDPTKKHLMLLDIKEMPKSQMQELAKMMRGMKDGELITVAMNNLKGIKFVELNGEIEIGYEKL